MAQWATCSRLVRLIFCRLRHYLRESRVSATRSASIKRVRHRTSRASKDSGVKRLQGDKLTVRGWKTIAPVALLGFGLVLASGIPAQQQQGAVPDAPTPQAPPPLPGVSGGIAPGTGAGETPSTPDSGSTAGAPAQPDRPPAKQPAVQQPPPNAQDAPPAQS